MQETIFTGALTTLLPGDTPSSKYKKYVEEILFDISMMVRMVNSEYIEMDYKAKHLTDPRRSELRRLMKLILIGVRKSINFFIFVWKFS